MERPGGRLHAAAWRRDYNLRLWQVKGGKVAEGAIGVGDVVVVGEVGGKALAGGGEEVV